MMKLYVDGDYMCHVNHADGRIEIETDIFDGKCDQYIEGFRLVPEGRTWIRDDGVVFEGFMLAPGMDIRILDAAQTEYEAAQSTIAELDEALLDAEYLLLTGGYEML